VEAGRVERGPLRFWRRCHRTLLLVPASRKGSLPGDLAASFWREFFDPRLSPIATAQAPERYGGWIFGSCPVRHEGKLACYNGQRKAAHLLDLLVADLLTTLAQKVSADPSRKQRRLDAPLNTRAGSNDGLAARLMLPTTCSDEWQTPNHYFFMVTAIFGNHSAGSSHDVMQAGYAYAPGGCPGRSAGFCHPSSDASWRASPDRPERPLPASWRGHDLRQFGSEVLQRDGDLNYRFRWGGRLLGCRRGFLGWWQ
jgi:hypothetical protein